MLFESAPSDTTWGARAASLRDPDGTNIFLLSWQAPAPTDEDALGVLRRYLDALQAHPSAEQMLADEVVTRDFETGFVGGFIWQGPDGLADFLSQRDGFFDERHDIRAILGTRTPSPAARSAFGSDPARVLPAPLERPVSLQRGVHGAGLSPLAATRRWERDVARRRSAHRGV